MKRFCIGILSALAAALSAFAAEPSISSLTATPRYPWNGLVDIDVAFTGDADLEYLVYLGVLDVEGGTNLPVRTVRGPDGATMPNPAPLGDPGAYRFTWNAAADLPGGFTAERASDSATFATNHKHKEQ